MSFVGTRPEVEKYVDQYSEEMMATLFLPAGITSYASIMYKDEDERIGAYQKQTGKSVDEIYREYILPEKMKYNLKYLKEFSIWRDALCIWLLAGVLFYTKIRRDDAKKRKKEYEIGRNVTVQEWTKQQKVPFNI